MKGDINWTRNIIYSHTYCLLTFSAKKIYKIRQAVVGVGYYFLRIHVKGVIEIFVMQGGKGHFVYLLIEFCQPTPGHK
jgi:hypothetical protein